MIQKLERNIKLAGIQCQLQDGQMYQHYLNNGIKKKIKTYY